MAAVFSSKSVRHAPSAKPSLLRPLFWTLGLQAALGGVLMMIHDKVVFDGGQAGGSVVMMNFVENGDEADTAVTPSKNPVKILPPVVVPERIEVKSSSKELPLASAHELPLPEGMLNTAETGELFLSNEDFGSLLPRREIGTAANRKQSAKSGKKAAETSSPTLASASSSKGAGNAVLTTARYKSAPLPPYPRSARSEGREGVVMLKLLIDEEGKPVEVCLAKSSGSSILDDVALDWVKNNWLFYPATDSAGPVESAMIAPLRFKLNS